MVLAATVGEAVNGILRYGEGTRDQMLEIDGKVDNFWWRST